MTVAPCCTGRTYSSVRRSVVPASLVASPCFEVSAGSSVAQPPSLSLSGREASRSAVGSDHLCEPDQPSKSAAPPTACSFGRATTTIA
jgi:hypothetical protein